MGNLKFNNELFLDNLELQRFKEFIFEEGWEEVVRQQVETWGIIRNNNLDYNFNYFRVSQGTPISGNVTIQMQVGTAIAYDQTLDRVRIIKNKFTSGIPFPEDGNWYWIKISPKYSNLEVGTATIDISGNLTGVGTKFTEVLRGQPDFASRIKFYKLQSDQLTYNPSSLNALEYDVLEVVSDTEAILQGDFANEIDLYYTVQGTFTPGYTVPSLDKQIFEYDDCTIEFVAETIGVVSPTKPSYTLGEEFFIYRVRFDAGNLIIQDYRNELFKIKQDFEIEYITNAKNPLIGIESMKYNSLLTPLDKNLVTVGWGFRSTTYTINSNLDKLTISAGNGGKYKTANAFASGNFDNWRLYFDYVRNTETVDSYSVPEKYLLIKSSVKNGTSIDLFLDKLALQDFIPITYSSLATYLNGDKVNVGGTFYILLDISLSAVSPVQAGYSGGTTYALGDYVTYGTGTYRSLAGSNLGNQPDISPDDWVKVWQTYTPNISIVPDAEDISIQFIVGSDVDSDVADSSSNRTFDLNIRNGYAEIEVIAINDDTITDPIYNVKYNYKNHKVYGPTYVIPTDTTGYIDEEGATIPYTSDVQKAFIKVLKNVNAYSNFKNRIDLGDNFGVIQIPDLEAFIAPLSGRTYELVVGSTKQNIEITGDLSTPLTGDVKINLSITSTVLNPLKNGNRFYLYFNTQLDNDNPIGGGSQHKIQIYQDTSTLLYELTQDEITKGQQFFIFTYESSISGGIWEMVHFDKDYNGDGAFKPGSEAASTSANIETISGKNILFVSGYYETIVLTATGDYTIDGFKTLNGKTINNLKIINSAAFEITFSDFSTYASPGTGVKRWSSGYGDDKLRYAGEIIGFTLDATSGIYVKTTGNVGLTTVDWDTTFPADRVFASTGGVFVSLGLTGDTYTVPLGPTRIYTLVAHAHFTKDTTSNPNSWWTGLRIRQNGITIGTTRIQKVQVGTALITSGQLETLIVTCIVEANPGDVFDLFSATDYDDYNILDIRFSKMGVPKQGDDES